MEIIVKRFEPHFNRALNKKIATRRQYNNEMKRQNMVSQEKGDHLAEKAQEKLRKPYKIGKDTEKFLSEVNMGSKNGKVKLSGRQIAFMEKKGVNFKRPDDKGLEGGFDNAMR